VNEQLLSKGIPYRLPRHFNLRSVYTNKKFKLSATARELILTHIAQKTPQYAKKLQTKAQNILLLKNHPENDVVQVKSRTQRWNTNHRDKITRHAYMADVQHVDSDTAPVNQPPTTSDPVVILEQIPPRDPPTPRLDNVTGANNVTNISGDTTAKRNQSLENAIRSNQDEEDTSPIARVGKIALSTFQAIKSHSPFSNKERGTVNPSERMSPVPLPFADSDADVSLLTMDSSVHGVTQTLAAELDNITAIPESGSDESNTNPENIDLDKIQKRLEYLMGGDVSPTTTTNEINKLKSEVDILIQTREVMNETLAEERQKSDGLLVKIASLNRELENMKVVLDQMKKTALQDYMDKDKFWQETFDKLSRQVTSLTKQNSELRSKYKEATTEYVELQDKNRQLAQMVSGMSDKNDSLQRHLDNCIERQANNDDNDKPCKCKETKIICQCECKCKCSKKKRKRRGSDDDDADDPDDDGASEDSDDDESDKQLAYDVNDQYVPETKLTSKQHKKQSKDTAYTVKYLNRYAHEKKGFVAFDTHGNTAKTRASFHVFMENLREMYGVNDLLADYPDMNLSTITHTKDNALGTFVKNKLSEFTKAALEGSIEHFRSGTQILIYLQKQFGKRNALDVKTACDNLNTKGMQSGESIQNYGFRFLKLIQQYKKCAKASGIAYNTIHNNEYIEIFLTHLLHGIDQTHALYNNVLSEHKKHQI
jgi:hypothetical protein